jgi:ubiquinone/menaquinone biosynthesis C-methylase UbiE
MSHIYQSKDVAERYDSARNLPEETLTLWKNKLVELVPPGPITQVLDLGSGTGRFIPMLQEAYKCQIIAIEPSQAMVREGKRHHQLELCNWLQGSAEQLPFKSGSIDLVWMCQVFHHLENKPLAIREIKRMLRPYGYLAVRNGTTESDGLIEWYKCFPEAREFDKGRIPNQAEIIETIVNQGLSLIKIQTVSQLFAHSFKEYYDKIGQRGLSSLIAISDEAFARGLKRLHEWASSKPVDEAIYEPVDLFIFRKQSN